MKKQNLIVLFLGFLIIQACTTKMDQKTYSKYQSSGNEISNQAQATLLANVGSAIQTGGPEYAVEFCNLKASGIVDSLNAVYQCNISRVSNKNRNQGNSLSTKTDQIIWQFFEDHSLSDTVIQVKNTFTYYKRINTAMPACLKCHGVPESDMNEATLTKLKMLYPNDLATGYQLNEFRGLWKVRFEAN